jgi:phosphinothricin tripeptide acetyl hydrolase
VQTEPKGEGKDDDMASPELDTVIEMLRTLSPVSGGTIAEQRANMDMATTMMPLPEDVTFTPVRAGAVSAEWVRAPGVADDAAIVYFHGGGYVMGSVRTHRLLVAGLSRACGTPVLSVDYRLAPEHPFPAAVDDGVAAYRFVRAAGTAAGRIAIAGDSAGGGLTVATLIALSDAGEALPAAGVCISPWLDLTLSGQSYITKAAADPMLQRALLAPWAAAYLAEKSAETPTASPLFADLRGLPPLLVHVGTAEVLLDDSTRFAARARDAGLDVDLSVYDDMIHVWHAFAFVLPEAQRAIDEIATYVRGALARG